MTVFVLIREEEDAYADVIGVYSTLRDAMSVKEGSWHKPYPTSDSWFLHGYEVFMITETVLHPMFPMIEEDE